MNELKLIGWMDEWMDGYGECVGMNGVEGLKEEWEGRFCVYVCFIDCLRD